MIIWRNQRPPAIANSLICPRPPAIATISCPSMSTNKDGTIIYETMLSNPRYMNSVRVTVEDLVLKLAIESQKPILRESKITVQRPKVICKVRENL